MLDRYVVSQMHIQILCFTLIASIHINSNNWPWSERLSKEWNPPAKETKLNLFQKSLRPNWGSIDLASIVEGFEDIARATYENITPNLFKAPNFKSTIDRVLVLIRRKLQYSCATHANNDLITKLIDCLFINTTSRWSRTHLLSPCFPSVLEKAIMTVLWSGQLSVISHKIKSSSER